MRCLSCSLVFAIMTCALMAGGCGYSTQTIYPTEVKTVTVRPIANRTFYRGVEFELREALIKEIEYRTPYKVVSDAVADSELTVTIVGLNQRRLSQTERGGLPQEMEAMLIANVEWRNLLTGDLLRERSGLARVGRYVPTRPVSENQAIGQSGAVESLAADIVAVMRSEWEME